jgi:hypothetical protein
MKLSEDKREILNNVIAGAIIVHYGALLASFVFFARQGYIGAGLNLLLIIVWIAIAIRVIK